VDLNNKYFSSLRVWKVSGSRFRSVKPKNTNWHLYWEFIWCFDFSKKTFIQAIMD